MFAHFFVIQNVTKAQGEKKLRDQGKPGENLSSFAANRFSYKIAVTH
jgi:hypothetical protein